MASHAVAPGLQSKWLARACVPPGTRYTVLNRLEWHCPYWEQEVQPSLWAKSIHSLREESATKHADESITLREQHESVLKAKQVEFADVIPVTHPITATRGYVATVMVTDQQDRKFRCAMAYAGYGGPRLSVSSTDIFRMEELKSTLQIMLCTTNASTAWLHQRMQRVMF